MAYGLGQDISCIKFLVVSDDKCSNDAKEAEILDLFGLPLNGLTWACFTLRYMDK